MTSVKVTFADAAKALNVHPNTLKNWQRSGKLPSAEKQKIKGVATWLVDLDEAGLVAAENNTALPVQSDITTPEQARTTVIEEVVQARQNPIDNNNQDHTNKDQQSLTQPNIEANIMLWRDSLVAPLVQELKDLRLENVEVNRANVNLIRDKEELARDNEELARENGELRERVRQLEARQTAQEAPQSQPEPVAAVDVVSVQGVRVPAPEPGKRRPWWSRLF